MPLSPKRLPNLPGVYQFLDANRRLIYVGKAASLRSRVRSYFQKGTELGPKTQLLVKKIADIEWIVVESEFEALLLEAVLIKKHQPQFNARARDDKSPLYIKITREEFPKVLTARGSDLKLEKNLPAARQATYFGPFPKAGTARRILLLLRRIFPYCQQKKIGPSPCFWSHLGLCQPCPAFVVRQPQSARGPLTAIYRQNIKRLAAVLSGKSKDVVGDLAHQMKQFAQKEEFEKAAEVREKIRDLSKLTAPYTPATAYIENPNLIEDRRSQEATELFHLIGRRARLRKVPRRLECFDASHISGTNPAVSSVTFVGGEAEKNFYRRFKISRGGKDDLALLSEAIKRRFAHREWGKPDLLVIDGGKGQVKAAKEALEALGIWLPVVGLTKRFETIIIAKGRSLPAGRQGFTILRPTPSSPALQLLRRVRDEAHRFARNYHLKLRLKTLHT